MSSNAGVPWCFSNELTLPHDPMVTGLPLLRAMSRYVESYESAHSSHGAHSQIAERLKLQPPLRVWAALLIKPHQKFIEEFEETWSCSLATRAIFR